MTSLSKLPVSRIQIRHRSENGSHFLPDRTSIGCDFRFYEVERAGALQRIDGQEKHVAFETPMPRGFEGREQAIDAATEHVRTQFARIGVDRSAVEVVVEVVEADDDAAADREG